MSFIANDIHSYINILVDVNIMILYSCSFKELIKEKKRLGRVDNFLVFYYVLKVPSFGLWDYFHMLILLLALLRKQSSHLYSFLLLSGGN